MANNLKCEYLEGSEERLTTKNDANSATNETGLTVSSDPTDLTNWKHDEATERAITGEDLVCQRADERVPSGKVETDERPNSDVAQ